MKIDLQEIELLFEYGKKVYKEEIKISTAIKKLAQKGINKNSASDYIYNYSNLVEGRLFTRTMNVKSTKYYLDKIYETLGTEPLKNALQSLSLHIDYYESITSHNVVKRKLLLKEYLEKHGMQSDEYFGEEIPEDDKLVEGSTKQIKINIYERNPLARRKCIEYHGAICKVCRFDFKEKYGEVGKGFIHIHHTKELSAIGKEYAVDYLRDLVPVCPNCHAMLHKKKPAYTINELKSLLR